MKKQIILGGQRAGKAALMEEARRDFIRRNPQAVTGVLTRAGWIIEKPASAADLVPELGVDHDAN